MLGILILGVPVGRDPKVGMLLLGVGVFVYVLGKLWPVKAPRDQDEE
jgi:hypothetical protein